MTRVPKSVKIGCLFGLCVDCVNPALQLFLIGLEVKDGAFGGHFVSQLFFLFVALSCDASLDLQFDTVRERRKQDDYVDYNLQAGDKEAAQAHLAAGLRWTHQITECYHVVQYYGHHPLINELKSKLEQGVEGSDCA